jgi:parallel beta-helix repeat protein
MKRTRILAALCALILSAILAGPTPTLAQGPRPEVDPVTYLVGSEADTPGLDCTESANCTLRSALEQANNRGGNATINFTAEIHIITLTATLPVLAQPSIHVQGTWHSVRINADNKGQAFVITGNDAMLSTLTIYGSAAGAANVWITGSAMSVTIASSRIGPSSWSDDTCDGSPNSHSGIYISSTGGSIPPGGYRAYIYGNSIARICGSPGDGLYLAGTDHIAVGMSPGGVAGPAERNNFDFNHNGITVDGGYHNSIRNSYMQSNQNSGMVISDSTGNEIMGNIIYLNENTGIELVGASQGNKVGCDKGGPGSSENTNYVVANVQEGIYIAGPDATQNSIACNSIGVHWNGASMGNTLNGVVLTSGAHDNFIGGGDLESNVISANGNDGVKIEGGAHNNEVSGNNIGLSISGAMGFGNAASGISLSGGAYNNLIGGDFITNGNKIGGNTFYGVYIGDSDTTGNSLRSNQIGTVISGTFTYPRPNGSDGITIRNGAHGNSIGAPGRFNYVSFNGGSGLYIWEAPSNVVDYSGFDQNAYYGVILAGAATSNTALSQVYMSNNGLDGLGERQGAFNNTWHDIFTAYNSGMGIDKYAESDDTNTPNVPVPSITSVNRATGAVRGTASASVVPFFGATVELYNAAVGYSSFVQTKRYVGSAATDSSGNWIITDTLMATYGTCYVAFETDAGIGLFGIYNYSSELGPSNCSSFLPLVMRN